MMNDNDISRSPTIAALGRYRVLQRIGRGGMGDVWLCEDPRLRRQVAIKTLPAHNQSDSEYALRFEREAQAAAALNHPHILPIHDYGQQLLQDAQVITYIVMPYIGGGSLADRVADYAAQNKFLPMQEIMTLLEQAAEAIDYAHERGIVHRDIKPGNMLLRNDNWLLLADFGIARILSSSEHLTQTGTGFGTPEYMAPEQARGRAVPASDNYSLAVIAYQLFAGRLPFSADTGYATTIQHMTMRPPSPRQFNPAISPALEQALLLGLAKHPTERPPTAHAFVSGLQRELAQAPFEVTFNPAASEMAQTMPARQTTRPGMRPDTTMVDEPPPTTEQATSLTAEKAKRKGVTRRKVLIGGGVTFVLAAGGLGTWAAVERLGGFPNVGPFARATATTQPKITPSPTPGPNDPVLMLQGHFRPVTSLAWSPQQNMLASVSDDQSVLLWDVEQLYQQRASTAKPQPEANKMVASGTSMLLGWSPDGKMLAVANSTAQAFANYGVTIFTSDLGGTAPGFGNTLTTGALNLNGVGWMQKKYLAAIAASIALDKNVFDLWLWDITQPKQAATHFSLPGVPTAPNEGQPPVLATSPDGATMAFALTDGVRMGQVAGAGNKLQWKMLPDTLQFKDVFTTSVNTLTWSPDSNQIGALSNSGGTTIAYWSKQGSRWQPSGQIHMDNILTTMAWCPAPGSSLVATGAKEGTVQLWQAGNSTQPIKTLTSGSITNEVQTLAWSADGKWLAASYQDTYDTILVWSQPSQTN
ncbi:MAG TPA: serine/threonine-protein kinase [Ktedonobacteraceae bacterium]|nr:serine/threonine-protein kinase [Ktedonobacteraceae bacterium]